MWSNKNLKGPCEAGRVIDQTGHPVIQKCERPGRWREYGVLPFGTILCDDCYVSMLLHDAEKLEVGHEA